MEGRREPVMRHITTLLLTIILVFTSGCTSTRVVEPDQRGSYSAAVQPGDRIKVTTLDERVREIRVTEVTETKVQGTLTADTHVQRKGRPVSIEWADVYSVQEVKVSAMKTIGAGLGVVVAVPIIAAAAFTGGCVSVGGC